MVPAQILHEVLHGSLRYGKRGGRNADRNNVAFKSMDLSCAMVQKSFQVFGQALFRRSLRELKAGEELLQLGVV